MKCSVVSLSADTTLEVGWLKYTEIRSAYLFAYTLPIIVATASTTAMMIIAMDADNGNGLRSRLAGDEAADCECGCEGD